MGDELKCRPESAETLPMTYKLYQLASALKGETPDGEFSAFELDLGSTDEQSPVVRLEKLIGYNRRASKQASPIAQHWHTTRESLSGFLKGLGSNTITPESLANVPEADRRNAAILMDSTEMLLSLMGSDEVCSEPLNVYRFAATPAEVQSELPAIYNGPNLYIRMGGEEDDGGLPDPSLKEPLTFTDDDLRLIDTFLGYNPESEIPADHLLLNDWHDVRAKIVGVRGEDNTIAPTSLKGLKGEEARTAAVVLQSWSGVLKILRSENWRAGRAYRDGGSPKPVPKTPRKPPAESTGFAAALASVRNFFAENHELMVTGLGVVGAIAVGVVLYLSGARRGERRILAETEPLMAQAEQRIRELENEVEELEDVKELKSNSKPRLATDHPDAPSVDDLPGTEASRSSSSSMSSISGVTPENLLMLDVDAKPIDTAEKAIIKAQAVAMYEVLQSQAYREAPNGTSVEDIVDSSCERDAIEITERAFSEFNRLTQSQEGLEKLSGMWEQQREKGLALVNRGIPWQLLTEVGQQHFNMQTSASPLAGKEMIALRQSEEKLSHPATLEEALVRALREGLRNPEKFLK